MNQDKLIKLKPLKDIDSVAWALFLKGLSWALPFLGLLGLLYGYKFGGILGALVGLVICAIVSVAASLITMLIANKFGELAEFLYRGPKANWSIQEQFEGALNQVRYHKRNRRFNLALIKVDEVLAKAPHFADALLLKANILWEGFNEPIETKRCLETIIKTTPESDSFHLWATTLYADIVKEEKKRLEEAGQ